MYAILAKCPLFRGITADKIKELIDGHGDYTVTDYSDKACIARRETAYSGLMILLSGRVHGEFSADGHTWLVDPIEAPQLIAPAFLFGGYNRLPIDVIADGEVKIMTLHRGFIFELMQSNVLILSNFIDILSNRANVWSKKILYLSFRSLQQKVAKYLLEHSSRGEQSLMVPDMVEIAEYFDATRSAVQTVLSEMEKRRLLSSDGRMITILNRQALEQIL